MGMGRPENNAWLASPWRSLGGLYVRKARPAVVLASDPSLDRGGSTDGWML